MELVYEYVFLNLAYGMDWGSVRSSQGRISTRPDLLKYWNNSWD